MREPTTLLANLRRARTLAVVMSAVSVSAALVGALAVSAGLTIEGVWIAVATFIVSMGGVGLFMLSRTIRVRSHPILQALEQSPVAISHLSLLRRETYWFGRKIVAYTYLVVRMSSNRCYEIWIRSVELDRAIAEIRELAPTLPINQHIQVKRLTLPL